MEKQHNIPPQDTEIEKSLLGAFLASREAQTEVFGILSSPDCFYARKHAIIYEAALLLKQRNDDIDLLTVTAELRRMGKLDEVGVYDITVISDNISGIAHIDTYCRIVLEKFIGRELIRIGMDIANSAFKGEIDVFELIDKAQTEIYKLTARLSGDEPKHISHHMSNVLTESEMQRNSGSEITGVLCGIDVIDKKTHGWQNSDLIVIGARPAVGKTAFSLNLALGAAMGGFTPLVYSLEMSATQLIKRLASNFATLEAAKLFNPVKLSNDEWSIYVEQSGKLAALPIYIEDNASLTVAQIRSRAYKLINKGVDINMIIIDYLQLISSTHQKGRSRENEVSTISRELKIMAKDLDVPVICLSQLNRAGEGKPTLSHLRESGAIEQDADVVMFLSNGDGDLSDYVVLDFAKFRNGSTEEIALNFQKQFQRFVPHNTLDKPLTPMQDIIKPYGGMPKTFNEDVPF